MEYGLGQRSLCGYNPTGRLVLILVLMEYGLGQVSNVEIKGEYPVLILVLMEYGLGLNENGFKLVDYN